MKQRNPFIVFLLGAITFGIYCIYWTVQTKKVLNQKTSKHVPTIWLVYGPWLFVVACYIAIAVSSAPAYGDEARNLAAGSNTTWDIIPVIALLGIALGVFVAMVTNVIFTYRYSEAVEEYTKGKMSTEVSLILLYITQQVGVAFVQNAYNNALEAEAQNGTPTPPQ